MALDFPAVETAQLLKGAVSEMLGLEVVRLEAVLESSHQALLLQQCSPQLALMPDSGPPGATGQ